MHIGHFLDGTTVRCIYLKMSFMLTWFTTLISFYWYQKIFIVFLFVVLMQPHKIPINAYFFCHITILVVTGHAHGDKPYFTNVRCGIPSHFPPSHILTGFSCLHLLLTDILWQLLVWSVDKPSCLTLTDSMEYKPCKTKALNKVKWLILQLYVPHRQLIYRISL